MFGAELPLPHSLNKGISQSDHMGKIQRKEAFGSIHYRDRK
jgi:hypothetical protein